MFRYTLLLLVVYSVICDDCKVFNFENLSDLQLNYDTSICENFQPWEAGSYESISMDSLQEVSTMFLRPEPNAMSCISTELFSMSSTGSIELNFYAEQPTVPISLTVIVFQYVPNGVDGTVMTQPITIGSGWQTYKFAITGSGTFDGYVSKAFCMYIVQRYVITK